MLRPLLSASVKETVEGVTGLVKVAETGGPRATQAAPGEGEVRSWAL